MQVIIVIAIPAEREKSENKENKILTKLEISTGSSVAEQYYCRKIKSFPQNHKIKICTTYRNVLAISKYENE